jgi:hypothetical protein
VDLKSPAPLLVGPDIVGDRRQKLADGVGAVAIRRTVAALAVDVCARHSPGVPLP